MAHVIDKSFELAAKWQQASLVADCFADDITDDVQDEDVVEAVLGFVPLTHGHVICSVIVNTLKQASVPIQASCVMVH